MLLSFKFSRLKSGALTPWRRTSLRLYHVIPQVLDVGGDLQPILQSLCAEALISASDGDSDWKLNFKEFSRCLDPDTD